MDRNDLVNKIVDDLIDNCTNDLQEYNGDELAQRKEMTSIIKKSLDGYWLIKGELL